MPTKHNPIYNYQYFINILQILLSEYLADNEPAKLLPLDLDKKCLILLSGGIDSTVLLFLAKSLELDIIGIELTYNGRPYAEIEAVRFLGELTKIEILTIEFPAIQTTSQKAVSLTESSTIYYSMVSNIAYHFGIKTILGGHILDDWYRTELKQATFQFFRKFNALLNLEYGENSPYIYMPFLYLTKTAVVKLGNRLSVPFERTWSCVSDTEHPCGTCEQCISRTNIFGN